MYWEPETCLEIYWEPETCLEMYWEPETCLRYYLKENQLERKCTRIWLVKKSIF